MSSVSTSSSSDLTPILGPAIGLVVAMAKNGVIGRAGDLPWRLPDELKYFKHLTVGHTLIMGRKTYDSIGRPLPRRTTIVLTRDSDFSADGVLVAHSLDEAFKLCTTNRTVTDPPKPSIFVVGGASVYAAALESAGHLFVTRVHGVVSGDVHFPEVRWDRWQLQESERHEADERHAYAFTMEHYGRRIESDPTSQLSSSAEPR